MPTFDGKTEKFELLEDLFQTSLKIHNQLTEDDRINFFHFLMRGDALQTFKNINDPTPENLEENLAVSRRKYVKPHSMTTAKQIPETRLWSSEPKVSRFSRRTSKTGQRRIRNSCPCHH